MKLYSDAFLNDSYLKYVGWTMHDKVRIFLQIGFLEKIISNKREENCDPKSMGMLYEYDGINKASEFLESF